MLRKAVRQDLDEVALRLFALDEAADKLQEERAQLRKRFIELSAKLERDGPSVYWPVPEVGKRLRLSWAESTPPVDWDKFARSVGPAVFFEVCAVRSASLDVQAWNRAVAEEQATDSQLQACIGEAGPRSPGLYIERIPKDRS